MVQKGSRMVKSFSVGKSHPYKTASGGRGNGKARAGVAKGVRFPRDARRGQKGAGKSKRDDDMSEDDDADSDMDKVG